MKKIMLALALVLGVSSTYAQKYMTRTGKVTFYSSTPVENIEAFNNESAFVIDSKTGDVAVQVPIKSFKFENALMQEHFNENYMESDKFPKAEYKGKITNIESVNLAKDGEYKVKMQGNMTIHGVTKVVTIPGTLSVKNGAVQALSKFEVKAADYGIKIPSVVAGKIAENIEVTVNSPLNLVK